jgi:hypothetical protein
LHDVRRDHNEQLGSPQNVISKNKVITIPIAITGPYGIVLLVRSSSIFSRVGWLPGRIVYGVFRDLSIAIFTNAYKPPKRPLRSRAEI